MSIGPNGVKFERPRRRRGALFMLALFVVEGIFTFFLYLSMAGKIFEAEPAKSAPGVPQLLSYQGRLTDTSGNPLGGAGTTYCFRYSIYDALSGGSKVWPSGVPANSTTTVADGVFNDTIGRMDTLTYDFFSTSTLFLNVEVNQTTSTCSGSWESLTPRQQITAAGFALTSENVYGSALWMPTSTKVQIGSAAGVSPGNQTLLSLDVVNSAETVGGACSNNGALWYNSSNLRALVCENSVIQEFSNADVISGIRADSTSTLISTGEVVFSASNNITISQSGNTLNFSVPNGGGATINQWWAPYPPNMTVTSELGNGSMFVWPVSSPVNVTATAVRHLISLTMTTSAASSHAGVISLAFGIYTNNAGTLSRASSASSAWQWSVTSNSVSTGAQSNVSSFSVLTGLRALQMAMNMNMTPGQYWFAMWSRTSTTNNNWFRASNAHISMVTNQFLGNISVASNSSNQLILGWGQYSNATTTTLVDPIAISNVKGASAAGQRRIPYIYFSNQTY